MGNLEHDTRVDRVGETPGGATRYHASISSDWRIWGPAGGYVAAIALRAAGAEAKIKRPASFSGHFIRMGNDHEVEIEVTPLQRGRRTESLHVVMTQDDRPLLQAIVRTAAEDTLLEHDFTQPPDVPDPEGLRTWPELFPDDPSPPIKFWENFESRIIDLDHAAHPFPKPKADPIYREWYKYIPQATFDDPFVDAARSLVLMDTRAWAAGYLPHQTDDVQAPNLDVTAWFHQPAHDSHWLLMDYEAPIATGALIGCHGRIWSRDRRLIASGGTQLLCIEAGAGIPNPEMPKKDPVRPADA
jgi:acyl-CoA thioesterase-2